jgi:hypothetical protein
MNSHGGVGWTVNIGALYAIWYTPMNTFWLVGSLVWVGGGPRLEQSGKLMVLRSEKVPPSAASGNRICQAPVPK